MDLGQITGPVLEEQMWQTLLDQEILPLTATTSMDMEITSLACAEMSSQANTAKESYQLGFGQDLQSNSVADVTSDCAEHLILPADDASVFQNLKYFCGESAQEKSLLMTSTNPSENHSDLVEKIPVPLSPVSPFSEKEITELQQQDNLMEFFNLSTGQMDHCEEFYDLNLLLEQVATHDAVESVNVSTKDEVFPTLLAAGSLESSILGSQSEQIHESSSSEPPTKKQRTLCTSTSENTCKTNSTQNGKKNLTPETTHQKYMEMRRKNNIASQRSRQIRKEKDKALEVTAVELENENRVLKEKAERLERQRDSLKNCLMTLIANKSSKA